MNAKKREEKRKITARIWALRKCSKFNVRTSKETMKWGDVARKSELQKMKQSKLLFVRLFHYYYCYDYYIFCSYNATNIKKKC